MSRVKRGAGSRRLAGEDKVKLARQARSCHSQDAVVGKDPLRRESAAGPATPRSVRRRRGLAKVYRA